MSNEWGPWIGRLLGQDMSHLEPYTVIDWMDTNGDILSGEDGYGTTAIGMNWDAEFAPVVAYRVKKEPVVEVRREAVIIGHGVTQIMAYAQCTYTDGKLTKIHWEVDQ